MPTEEWEVIFRQYLIACAHAVAAELKDSDRDAEERGDLFEFMLRGGLYCPECWVRYGEAIKLRKKRWLLGCDEHDYKLP